MPTTPEFEQAANIADEWLDDLVTRLGWHDRRRAYISLVATLHALRDALPHESAIDLGGPLPVILRGLYYDGWHARGLATAHTRGAFLERIEDGVHHDLGIDADAVARAVLAMLAARLTPVEVENAKAATPHALHEFWPS
jgi:uncharacterized protein (DUF2267 family)